MGLFSSLFERTPPSWSGFTDRAAFKRFIQLAREALAAAGHPQVSWRLEQGEAIFTAEVGDVPASIRDLAGRCARLPEDQWQRELLAFARHKGDPLGDRRPPKEPRRAWPRAERWKFDRAAVRTQVFSAAYLGMPPAKNKLVTRLVFEGLWEVVTLVFPGGERTLPRGDIGACGLSEDDLFALGRAQAAATTETQVTSALADGRAIEIAVSNGFYLPAKSLAAIEQVEAPDGFLVCFVSWHHVCLLALEPGEPREPAVAALKTLAAHLEQNISVTQAEALGSRIGYFKKGEGWTAVA